jgi:hypothetical protein
MDKYFSWKRLLYDGGSFWRIDTLEFENEMASNIKCIMGINIFMVY